MFGMNDRERALYERLLTEKEEQLRERDRLIIALSDQVDWHRAQSGTYVPNHLTETGPVLAEEDAAFQQIIDNLQIGDPNAMHLSEDEEELLYQLKHAGADPEAVAAALQAVHGVEELPFDPE